MAINKKIAFLGGGNMAEALIKGVLAAHTVNFDQVTATDVSEARLVHLRNTHGIGSRKNNREAVAASDSIILCVKPQAIDTVLAEIAPETGGGKLVISIAAGITIGRIEAALAPGTRVVRVMPNTPALVLAGAAGLSRGTNATDADMAVAREIFGSIGRAVEVDEKLMDAVTGLSGSGPAYVFTVIEALADGGVKVGIPRPLALELAAQTVFGSAKMVLETKEHPAKLRDMVTSPGGTTIAGMHEIEKGKLRATLISAVEAATKRGSELGGKKETKVRGSQGGKVGKKRQKLKTSRKRPKVRR